MYKTTIIFFLLLIPAWSVDPMLQSSRCVGGVPSSSGKLSLCMNNLRSQSNKLLYFDGEMIYAECEHSHAGQELMFRNNGKLVYSTKYKQKSANRVAMLVKMKSEYINAIFKCRGGNTTLESFISLYQPPNNDPIIKANGLRLGHGNFAYFRNSQKEPINVTFYSKDSLSVSVSYAKGATIFSKSFSKKVDTQKETVLNEINFMATPNPKYTLSRHHLFINFEVDRANLKLGPLMLEMEEICDELCFDPYFTGLDPSKVLAKYISSKNLNVIKYELDFEEDIVYFGCDSVSSGGVITINDKVSNNKSFKLYTKNGTTTHLRRMNCTSIENGDVKSTILDITRKKVSAKITPLVEYGEETVILSRDDQTPAPVEHELETINCEGSPNISVITVFIAIIVTMIITAVITTIIDRACWKGRAIGTPEQEIGLQSDDTDNEASENMYEKVVYAASKSDSTEPAVDIANRPAFPLPPEEREENKKYIHYDTPYEHRIFRQGPRPRGRGQPSGRLAPNSRTMRKL